MDKGTFISCVFCNFMTGNKIDLIKHISDKHSGILPTNVSHVMSKLAQERERASNESVVVKEETSGSKPESDLGEPSELKPNSPVNNLIDIKPCIDNVSIYTAEKLLEPNKKKTRYQFESVPYSATSDNLLDEKPQDSDFSLRLNTASVKKELNLNTSCSTSSQWCETYEKGDILYDIKPCVTSPIDHMDMNQDKECTPFSECADIDSSNVESFKNRDVGIGDAEYGNSHVHSYHSNRDVPTFSFRMESDIVGGQQTVSLSLPKQLIQSLEMHIKEKPGTKSINQRSNCMYQKSVDDLVSGYKYNVNDIVENETDAFQKGESDDALVDDLVSGYNVNDIVKNETDALQKGESVDALVDEKKCENNENCDKNIITSTRNVDDTISNSNLKRKDFFRCWKCLRKFWRSHNVKKHIIQNHSTALCAFSFSQVDVGDSCNLPQILMFCPNKCKYSTLELQAICYHMATCKKRVSKSDGKSYKDIQKKFIAYGYYKLKDVVASGSIMKRKKKRSHHAVSKKRKQSSISCNSTDDAIEASEGKETSHAKIKPVSSARGTAELSEEITEIKAQETNIKEKENNEIYKCKECSFTFSTNSVLESHVEHCHTEKYSHIMSNSETGRRKKKPKIRSQQCHICGKRFCHVSKLEAHMRHHTGIKPFKCSVCGRTFSQRGNLQVHLMLHKGQRPFKCNICGKGFTQKVNAQSHMKAHERKEIFKCHKCNKKFLSADELENHASNHANEKPLNCKKCGKSFTLMTELQAHFSEMHYCCYRGEKPFKCDHCEKTFTFSDNCQIHMRTHMVEQSPKHEDNEADALNLDQANDFQKPVPMQTREKMFTCNECGKKFSRSVSLQIHMRMHAWE